MIKSCYGMGLGFYQSQREEKPDLEFSPPEIIGLNGHPWRLGYACLCFVYGAVFFVL